MKKTLLITLGSLAGASAVLLIQRRRVQRPGGIDINRAERNQLLKLSGLNQDLVDRIIEHRPYRNKVELVSRRVIPDVTYNRIRQRISTNIGLAAEDPKVLTSRLEKVVG